MAITLGYRARYGTEISATATVMGAVLGLSVAAACLVFQPMTTANSVWLEHSAYSQILSGLVLVSAIPAVLLLPAPKEISHPGEFHALILFSITGLLFALRAQHLLLLFVSLELASLTLYLLAGFSRTSKAAEASMKFFLFGAVSAAFMLFGISLLYGYSKDLGYIALQEAGKHGVLPAFAVAGLLMLLVGFFFKLAAAPFHAWSPDVYQGAPVSTVTLIAGISKIATVAILARLLTQAFGAAQGSAAWGDIRQGWSLWLCFPALLSLVVGTLLALAQTHVRRLIAYSAIANMGYILLGLLAGSPQAQAATLYYVVVYGLASTGALAVTAAIERSQGSDTLDAFRGLSDRAPGQAIALLICMTSLAGLPPLAGFMGKFAIFSATMASHPGTGVLPSHTWLVVPAAIASAVSLYYYLRILKASFTPLTPQSSPASSIVRHALPIAHTMAIGIPAFLLLILGLFPSLLLGAIDLAIGHPFSQR